MLPVLVAALSLLVDVAVFAAPQPGTTEEISFLMPNVKPQEPDTYLCKSMKVEDAHRYITGFVPKADAHIAHHILLYGCNVPGAHPGEVWNCGEMSTSSSSYHIGAVCQEGNSILYAWAMDAPRLALPEDVGFVVGQATPIKYLVIQVHYKNVTKFLPPQNGQDSSGISMITTLTPSKKQAAVYLMSTGGHIPAHTVEYFEAACDFDEDIEIFPFAYRTHAHSLGRVISCYLIRDGEWTEIGRKDPRLPEMFYNVTTPGVSVKRGDILAARCTMENTQDHVVAIGSTQKDEMCNCYLMYYVEHPPIMKEHNCATMGPPMWYWQNFYDQKKLNLKAAPNTISVIPGTEKPLIRNVTNKDEYKSIEELMEVPGNFEDIETDEAVDEAIHNMSPGELVYVVEQLASRQEDEDDRDQLWQEQLRRQQEIDAESNDETGSNYDIENMLPFHRK